MSHLTMDEMTLVQRSTLYLNLILVVEKKIKEIENSSHTLKELYSAATYSVLDLIQKDHLEIKRKLKQADIKVVDDTRALDNSFAQHYTVFYRGRSQPFAITNEHARSELSRLMGFYSDEVNLKLKN